MKATPSIVKAVPGGTPRNRKAPPRVAAARASAGLARPTPAAVVAGMTEGKRECVLPFFSCLCV